VPLIIEPRPDAKPAQDEPGTIVCPRDATPQQYRQLKAHAETKGLPFRVAEWGEA
jgi:hypothetical protein